MTVVQLFQSKCTTPLAKDSCYGVFSAKAAELASHERKLKSKTRPQNSEKHPEKYLFQKHFLWYYAIFRKRKFVILYTIDNPNSI